MFVYTVRRLAAMIPILLIVSLITFLFLRLVPGDPARLVAGQEATAADLEMVRAELGLNLPLHEQYWRYLSRALQGDFGQSYRMGQPVASMIRERFLPTLELSLYSMIWAVLAGLAMGVTAAVNRGKWQDRLTMSLAVVGISLPSFWLALLLIELFAVKLGWLPAGGSGSLSHIVLPSITLGSGVAAVTARFTRSSLLETLREDYVRTARAKGAGAPRVVWRHAMRNAMIPVVTMTGLQFGFLLGGSVVVEAIFAWPGMGKLLIDAVNYRDYPVIQAEMLLFALEFMIINLTVDLLYGSLHPQIRLTRA